MKTQQLETSTGKTSVPKNMTNMVLNLTKSESSNEAKWNTTFELLNNSFMAEFNKKLESMQNHIDDMTESMEKRLTDKLSSIFESVQKLITKQNQPISNMESHMNNQQSAEAKLMIVTQDERSMKIKSSPSGN